MPKKLQLLVPLVGPEGPQGPKGDAGSAGKDGATFKPSVTEDGILSWTNDKGLANPTPVAIKNSGIHIGAEEPTNPNANIWIFPDEDVEEPTDDTVCIPAPETAEIGQTIVVKAVDENGKPTEWEAADFPAGGDSAGWKLVTNVTVEEDVDRLTIETDIDGKLLSELGYSELFIRYKLLGLGTGNYTSRYSNLLIHFCGGYPGGRNASFANVGNGYDDVEASVYAIYPKQINDTNVATTGVAIHNNGLVKPFLISNGVLASANFQTGAGIKAGSQIIVYGR